MATTGNELKNIYTAELTEEMARRLRAVQPGFPAARFVEHGCRGLLALDMKDRVRHLALAMRTHLDEHYPRALAVIVKALGPVDGLPPMTGLQVWPFCHFVEQYGLEHLDDSMHAMHTLTKHFTCEFAIRPYIIAEPERVLRQLRVWASDPSPEVRRLVSEGTRPRLPWGPRLRMFQENPAPVLELLDMLYGDADVVVRRSVANNLNDITKDHPDLVVATVRRWSKGANGQTWWVIRHALRSLTKAGHPGALALLGYDQDTDLAVELQLDEPVVHLGDAVGMRLLLRSLAQSNQSLVIDYAVHHQKANGSLSPKVFKWCRRMLSAGEQLEIVRRHAIRPVTTRTYYPGLHRVEILINGVSRAAAEFTLQMDKTALMTP